MPRAGRRARPSTRFRTSIWGFGRRTTPTSIRCHSFRRGVSPTLRRHPRRRPHHLRLPRSPRHNRRLLRPRSSPFPSLHPRPRRWPPSPSVVCRPVRVRHAPWSRPRLGPAPVASDPRGEVRPPCQRGDLVLDGSSVRPRSMRGPLRRTRASELRPGRRRRWRLPGRPPSGVGASSSQCRSEPPTASATTKLEAASGSPPGVRARAVSASCSRWGSSSCSPSAGRDGLSRVRSAESRSL